MKLAFKKRFHPENFPEYVLFVNGLMIIVRLKKKFNRKFLILFIYYQKNYVLVSLNEPYETNLFL